ADLSDFEFVAKLFRYILAPRLKFGAGPFESMVGMSKADELLELSVVFTVGGRNDHYPGTNIAKNIPFKGTKAIQVHVFDHFNHDGGIKSLGSIIQISE